MNQDPNEDPRPEWLKNAKPIWSEDDATCYLDDHESLDQAWRKKFGTRRELEIKRSIFIIGDAEYILYQSGRIAVISYPGNCEILQVNQ